MIGESWEIVDRAEADSPLGGEFGSLGRLRRERTAWLMGPDWPADKPFPILVKWLDCRERLSLQVHPPKDVAPELGGEPKTENWYIVECTGDAALLAGLKPGVTREVFANALQLGDLEPLVCRLPSAPGKSLFVRSGRLHAIDAGNLILEIQQNSDTTYRVYDWGRVGLDGQPRELHVEASMRSIDFNDFEPEMLQPTGRESILADAEEFRLQRWERQSGEVMAFAANEQPRILSVVSGSLIAENGERLTRGDNVILPYAEASRWRVEADAVCLLTDQFHRP